MPDTGAPYNLHYPGANDAANVPADMQLLAANVVTALNKVATDADKANDGLEASIKKPPTVCQGSISPSLTAGDTKSVPIVFKNSAGVAVTFKTQPSVQVTVNSTVPERCSVGVGSVTTKGCTIYAHRTTDAVTTIWWLAIGEAV